MEYYDVYDQNYIRLAKNKCKIILSKVEVLDHSEYVIYEITDDLIKKIKMLNRISGTGWPAISVMISGIKDYQVGAMSGGKHLKLIADDGKFLFIKWNFNGDWDQFDGGLSAIGSLDSGCFGRTYYRQMIMSDWIIDNFKNL